MTSVSGHKDVQSWAFQLLSHACSREEMWSCCATLYVLYLWVSCSHSPSEVFLQATETGPNYEKKFTTCQDLKNAENSICEQFLDSFISLTTQLSQLRFRHRWQCCLHGGEWPSHRPSLNTWIKTSSRCVALAWDVLSLALSLSLYLTIPLPPTPTPTPTRTPTLTLSLSLSLSLTLSLSLSLLLSFSLSLSILAWSSLHRNYKNARTTLSREWIVPRNPVFIYRPGWRSTRVPRWSCVLAS